MPKTPPGPESFPDEDTHHPELGNPLIDHPEVEPAYEQKLAGPEPMFACLVMQVTVGKESPSYEGDPDEEYRVPATPLTVLRPEDLEKGLLMYRPEPEPQQVFEITETVDPEVPRTSDKEVEVKVYRSTGPLKGTSANELEVETKRTTLTVEEICRELTVLNLDLGPQTFPS